MEQIFSWVLERSLGISVVLLAVMLLQPFLHRRYRPQLNCLVWTALALCLLIPFSLPRTKQAVVTIDWESLIARQEEQMNGAAGTEPEQLSQAEGLPVQSAQRRPVQWLPAIWLAGAATVLVGQGGIYLATRKKLLRWSTAVEEPRTKLLLSHCQQELGMQEQVRLMRCCLLDTPMLMGLWRPCILLPEVELEEQQLRYVLLHELSHRRRRDLWLKFLLLVAKAVHWFNPLVWVMYVLANRDLELSCDEMVLRLLGIENRSAYAMALLEMEEKRSGFGALYSAFGKNAIEERIGAIMKMKKRSLLSAVMAVVLVFTLTACLATSPVEEETSAQTAEEKNTIESETVLVTSELTENKKEKIAEKEQGQSDAVRKRYIVSYWKEPQELYRGDYQAKGFRFEEDGTLYYKDQLVRYFVDGATVEPHDGSYTIDDIRYKEQLCAYLYEYYNEEGVIDLYTVRWEDRGTSSPTSRGLGELMKVEIFDPDTFDDRAFIYATEVDWENKTGGHNYILDDEIISAQATSDYKEENLSWDEKLEKLDALKEYGVTYEKIDEGIQMHYQGYLVNRLVYAGADVPHSFTLTSVGVPMERRASMSVYVDVSSSGEVEISNDWPLVGSIVLFRNYGIAYDEEQKAWAYNGQIIKYFIDGVDGQFPFLLRDDGEINLKVNYDENHYISGLEKISDEQAQALWEQAEAADSQTGQTEPTVQPTQTQQLATDTTTAAAPIAPVKETTMVEDVSHAGDTNSRRYWAQEGTPVTCSVAGEVVASGWESGYGNRVQVQDASGITWTYAHLKEISAQQGDQLQAGEQLGTVGHTGNAGSPTTYCLGLYAEKDGQELNVAQLFARGEEISL